MSSGRPILREEKDEGVENDIEEADLYRFTRYRWIHNEEKELSKRYLEFDLGKLIDAAVQGTRFKYCSKVLKCKEGLHNKVLVMTMDDGTEIVAKLPNPNAGPRYLTTESEVATREFLREVLQIPVPRIYGWSSDKRNPVGAEYILEEKVSGERLGTMWTSMPKKSKLDIISQVAELENRLASLEFQSHGCIYFRDAFLGQRIIKRPLITQPPISSAVADRFVMGPLTTAELWDDEENALEMDCGPWDNFSNYMISLGKNEMAWVQANAKPRKSRHHSTDVPELPASYISLLEQCLEITPYLTPPATRVDVHSPTLWHPDLHRDNVFVDPDTNKITGIIDWQSTTVAPLFLQAGVPRMVRHPRPVEQNWAVPGKPDNYDALSEDERSRVDSDIESMTYHKYYLYQSFKKNPRHWTCLEQQSGLDLRTTPVKLVSKAWKNGQVFYLREALMKVVNGWDELSDSNTCPIEFSEEVYQIHAQEESNINAVGEILRIFRDENVLPVDGMVDPIDYERAKRSCLKFKNIFIGLASTPEERKLHAKLWPYQDVES